MISDFYDDIRALTLAIEQSGDKGTMERAARYFTNSNAENFAKEYGLGSETPQLSALIKALPDDHSPYWYRAHDTGRMFSLEYKLAEVFEAKGRYVEERISAGYSDSAQTELEQALRSVEISGDEGRQRDVAFLFAQFVSGHPMRRMLDQFARISQYQNESPAAQHTTMALRCLNREQNRGDACGKVATLMLKVLRS